MERMKIKCNGKEWVPVKTRLVSSHWIKINTSNCNKQYNSRIETLVPDNWMKIYSSTLRSPLAQEIQITNYLLKHVQEKKLNEVYHHKGNVHLCDRNTKFYIHLEHHYISNPSQNKQEILKTKIGRFHQVNEYYLPKLSF